MAEIRESRPAGDTTEPAQSISTAIKNTPIVAPITLNHPKAVAPAFVVFTFTDDGELKRRNVYLSLHSALKAKERAEARGSRFQLMLCELVPVPHKAIVVVGGGDQ